MQGPISSDLSRLTLVYTFRCQNYTLVSSGVERKPLVTLFLPTKVGQIFFSKQKTLKLAVNDRKYVFHFRPKPKPKLEKHLALGRIPKPKPKVQIYVKIGGILLKFNVSNDLSN